MGYVLLTGGTGLLGRYLLRDLLEQSVPVAVLVRPSRRHDPHVRVEALMRSWDELLGRSLPRPIVLTGDICSPDLGMSPREIKWAAENCDSLLHNAASLSFVSTGRDAEPWRSNVDGTKYVLDFCAQAGIRKFHHVSTAYVAGKRTGLCYENQLNEGQEFANPYEASKVEAEELVRNSRHLDQVTCFRPAIIIGDSDSGLTFTYHNFYAIVQISHTLRQRIAVGCGNKLNASFFQLQATGMERKNLVPVDWVSEAMASIITQPHLHGKTYHLTPRVPIQIRLMCDVVEEVLDLYGLRFTTNGVPENSLSEEEQIFHHHMQVYASYWRDDPVFDSTNTQTALPDLPCPHVDRAMLQKMARTAIENRFNWRDPKVEQAMLGVAG
jgi:thioester reductase-like protein